MKSLVHIQRRISCALIAIALVATRFAPVRAYAATVDKAETVHVQTDASGTVTSITVEDVLANEVGAATLPDASTLTDIAADDDAQSYTSTGEEAIIWTTDGKSVSYRGTSDAMPPVSLAISYTLDGVAIEPERLAGASGRLVMRIDYTAARSATGGSQVPFLCMSVIMLDDEVFSDVQVTNARLIEDKGSMAVIGYALPGLEESLGLADSTLDIDLELPEYLELSADVSDFALDPIYTIVTPELFSELDSDELGLDLGDLDGADALSEAMTTLVEGSSSLTEGLGQLTTGSAALGGGAQALKEALGMLPDAYAGLSTGAHALADGLSTASESTSQLADGASALVDAAQGTVDAITQAQGSVTAASTSAQADQEALAALAAEDGALAGAAALSLEAHDAAERASQVLGDAEASLQEQKQPVADALATTGSGLTDTTDALALAQDTLSSLEGLDPEQQATVDAALATIESVQQALATAQEDTASASVALEGISLTLPESFASDLATLESAASTLGEQQDDITAAHDALTESATLPSLTAATQQLAGASALSSATAGGTSQLASGLSALAGGIAQSTAGAGSLADGIDRLAGSSPQLLEGADQLASGATQLTTALGQAQSGSQQLTSGLTTFKDAGINSLVSELKGLGAEVDDLQDRLDTLHDAANSYDNFSGKAEGQTSSVRFIYKTEQIG